MRARLLSANGRYAGGIARLAPSMTPYTLKAMGALVCAVVVFGAAPSFAEDGAAPMPEKPLRPLDLLRAKNKNVDDALLKERQNLREDRRALIENTMDVNVDTRGERKEFRMNVIQNMKAMRADVQARLDTATTEEEKQAILEGARLNRAEFRMQVKTDAEAMRADFQERRGDVQEERRALAKRHLSMVLRRLVNALERFDQILARIDSRIEKLQNDGVDVTAALSASAEASASIDAASVAVAAAQAAIETAAASDAPKDRMAEVRAAVRAAIDAVKAAHESLKNTLRVLKGTAPPPSAEGETATTTE